MKKTQEIKYKDEIWERILNSKYEISNYGRVRRFYKYKYRYLKTFRKGSIQVIKLHIDEKGKDYNVAKLVIETFNRKLKAEEVAYHKYQTIDYQIFKLQLDQKRVKGLVGNLIENQL